VHLFGARNEIVAFQLMIQSNALGASGVDVKLDTLRSVSYVISNTGGSGDPLSYTGKHIELFVEQYLNVTVRTSTGMRGILTPNLLTTTLDRFQTGWFRLK